jgi:hypothetical protein
MESLTGGQTKITAARLAALSCLFFLISLGLGYPVLNRYDPRQTPGLADVKTYAALVTGTVGADAGHVRFRVLVPWLARPFYQLAKGRVVSWDPAVFGLLAADSLFVAATAALIVLLGTRLLGRYAVSLVASLLYLVNFAVPNLRLAGLVDAGEGFFLLALLWSLSERQLGALPAIAVLGAMTKESFIPFSIVFTAAWWLVVRKASGSPARSAAWILTSWAASVATMVGLQWWVGGSFVSPIHFAATLQGNHEYMPHFAWSLWDRNFWYIFLWLLPTAVPNLKRFPKSWLISAAATSTMIFVLDGYYGGTAGTVGRALFSVAGPLLSLSSALLLLGISDRSPDNQSGFNQIAVH